MNDNCFKRPYFLVLLLDLNYAIYQSLVVTLEITSSPSNRMDRFYEHIKAEVLRKATLLTYRDFGFILENYVPSIYFFIGNQKFVVSRGRVYLRIEFGPIAECPVHYRMQNYLLWGLNMDGFSSWCHVARPGQSVLYDSERQLIDRFMNNL